MNKALPWIMLVLLAGQASAQVGRGVITGEVRTPAGEPATEIRIAAMEAPTAQTSQSLLMASFAQTDRAGKFRLDDLPPGRYYIVAGKLDQPVYYPGTRDLAAAKAIVVTAGTTISDIAFTVVQPLKIAGRVEGIEDPDARLGTIILRQDTGSIEPRTSISGMATLPLMAFLESAIFADGRFEFSDIAPGVYALAFLNVQVPGRFQIIHPSIGASIGPGGTPGASSNSVVVADRSVRDLIVSFGRPVPIRVAVDQDGPMPPFELSFTGVQDIPARVSVSTGGPSNKALLMGNHDVSVSGLPDGYAVKSVMYGAKDVLREPLTIGKVIDEIVVNIAVSDPPPWVRVSGRVIGAGSPARIPGTQLRLLSPSTRLAAAAPVQPDGSFRFDKVFPGTYRAQFDPQPDGISDILMTIPGSGLDGIELNVPERRKVQGQVTVPNAAAIPAVKITLEESTPIAVEPSSVTVLPVHRELTIDQTGSFSAVAPEGEYRVAVTNLPIPFAVQSITSGPLNLWTDTLKIRGSDTTNITVALTVPTFDVAGHVHAARGEKDSEALNLTLSGAGLWEALQVRPDADGAYRFATIPSGNYKLRVEPGGAETPVFVNRANVTDMDIVLLRGRILGAADGPVPAMKVWFSTASDPLSAITDVRTDGTFAVALLKGEYRVQLSIPSGHRLKSFGIGTIDLRNETLKVSGDGPRDLQAVLEPSN